MFFGREFVSVWICKTEIFSYENKEFRRLWFIEVLGVICKCNHDQICWSE